MVPGNAERGFNVLARPNQAFARPAACWSPNGRVSAIPCQSTIGAGLRRYLPACAGILLGLSVLLQLAACGSGSRPVSSRPPPSTQQPPPPPPPPTLADAEGFWSGTTLWRCDIWHVSTLITPEGRLFASTPAGLYAGSVSLEAPFDLTAVNYGFFRDDTPVLVARPDADLLAISSVQAKHELVLRWSAQSQNFCSPNSSALDYDPLYDRPASLSIISGVYTNGDLSLSVNSDGVVSGSDINSCVFNGTVAVVHADRNYYSATIDVDNCPGSGRLEGVAFLDDTGEGVHNHVLRLVVANPEHALGLWLEK